MAFFGPRKSDKLDGREAVTLIGEEAYFHGVIAAKGSLRVEGVLEGDVTDGVSVEVGKRGRVKGNIAAESLTVAGEVLGDVIASRSIELLPQSRLRGNIRTPTLRVEEGAFFEGSCAMAEAGDPHPRRRDESPDEALQAAENSP